VLAETFHLIVGKTGDASHVDAYAFAVRVEHEAAGVTRFPWICEKDPQGNGVVQRPAARCDFDDFCLKDTRFPAIHLNVGPLRNVSLRGERVQMRRQLCLRHLNQGGINSFRGDVEKDAFWRHMEEESIEVSERQRNILNMLLDGFEGKLTTEKWSKLAKTSHDTALRDIQQLIEKRILKQEKDGGRSTSYVLARDRST
jgi:hypothetical protein